MTKLQGLEKRVDELAPKVALPLCPPDPKCLVGKCYVRALLFCAEHDKTEGVEAVNKFLEEEVKRAGGEHWCDPNIRECLRLRRWFIQNDKLENLVPRLCYTTSVEQVDRDIKEQEASLDKHRGVIA